MKDIRSLLVILKPLVPHMIITILLGTLGYLAISIISLFGGMAVIQWGGYEHYGSIYGLLGIIVAAGTLRAGFRLSEQYCTHYIAFRLLAIIRERIFTITRSLSQGQLKRFQKGEFMNIVTKDVELLEVFYAHTIAPVFIGVVTTILYVGVFSILHPWYGLAALLSYIMIAYVVPKIVFRIGEHAAEVYRGQFGSVSNYMMDALKGMKELVIFGYQKQTILAIDVHSEQLNDTTLRLKKHEGLLKAWTDCALYGAVFLQIGISIYLYSNGQIGAPAALLALLLLFSSFGPSLALSQLSASLVHTFASAKRVLHLLRIEPELANNGTNEMNEIRSIAFQEVAFGYKEQSPLYHDVNMTWHKGQIIGIKGANGMGKSTLISLLLQDLKCSSGHIKLNGLPAESYRLEDLRSQFSTVDANTIVFSDTLRRNIAMFKEDYDDVDIQYACEKAGLGEFIRELPNGLNTYMQEYAANISSGQLQRIALARLFLKNSSVFILDEPTSNLDALTERLILNTIQEHAADKLIIIISHQDQVLAMADIVYHIKQQAIKAA